MTKTQRPLRPSGTRDGLTLPLTTEKVVPTGRPHDEGDHGKVGDRGKEDHHESPAIRPVAENAMVAGFVAFLSWVFGRPAGI